MTEINNLDTDINFLKTLGHSTQALGLHAGVDRTRENSRTFTITDDFKGLLNIKPKTYCDQHLAAGENVIYPIAGKIGIEPFVHEFVRLALFADLGPEAGNDKGAPTMVDTLKFTTTLTGSATPKVTFSPVGRGLNLADASLTALATRTDLHTLVMGLSVVTAAPEPGPRGKAMFGRLLTAQGGGTRRTAAEAVDQEIYRQALSRSVIVRQ